MIIKNSISPRLKDFNLICKNHNVRFFLTIIFIIVSIIPVFSQEVKVEAEKGNLSGSLSVFKALSGFSGTGYVGRFESSSDKLTMTVPVTVETKYDILVGYCAEYGTKTINVDVNGTKSALEIPQIDGKFHEVKFGTLNLKAGNIPVIVTPSWTWFHIDYVRIKKSEGSGTGFNISGSPVNGNANQVTRNLYSFLKDNFREKAVSGVMTLKPLNDNSNEITWLKSNTGKEPALLGLDFMDHTGNNTWVNNPDLIKDAKTWSGKNGIVALCWHWRDPSWATVSFYTKTSDKPDGTTFDITVVNDTESAGYKAMIRDMDIVAGSLKELQTAGVAVLWRPLHEAAGGWFWWGARGADPCIKLWRLMYDRFTNYHQLNNLLWVWTTTDDSKALTWYPGDAYVDILGMDIYPGEYQHGSQIISFNKVKEIFGGKKIITLSECGSIPYPESMQSEGAYWSWFMPWYGTHTKDAKHNSADDWKKILGSEYIITLDEMPRLATYTSSSGIEPKSDPSGSFKAFWESNGIQLHMPCTIENCHIRLFNVSGEMLFQKMDVPGNYCAIPVPGLKSGIYLLQIYNNYRREVIKLAR